MFLFVGLWHYVITLDAVEYSWPQAKIFSRAKIKNSICLRLRIITSREEALLRDGSIASWL